MYKSQSETYSTKSQKSTQTQQDELSLSLPKISSEMPQEKPLQSRPLSRDERFLPAVKSIHSWFGEEDEEE